MLRIGVVLLVASVCLGVPSAGRAQGGALLRPIDRTLSGRLFPQPTARNGLEDVVAAGLLAYRHPALRAASARSAGSLAAKRRALADRELAKALALTRRGLSKSFEPVGPGQLEEFRATVGSLVDALLDLLEVDQYVRFAEGEVVAAIGCLRDGLRLRRAVQQSYSSSGGVGTSAVTRLMDALGRRFEQLAVGDCERLSALVREELSKPEPVLAQLEEMRRWYRTLAEHFRSDPVALVWSLHGREFTYPDGPHDRAQALREELEALVRDRPGEIAPFVNQLRALQERACDHALAESRRPSWERRTLHLEANTLAERYFALLYGGSSPGLDPMFPLDQAASRQARLQLLGVHAAICRFRWESDRLPKDLAELALGSLLTDPYSGQPFRYEPARRTYRLSSAGPWERPYGERPASGNRRPIFIPREDGLPPDG